MPYSGTTWVEGVTGMSAANFNNMEGQYYEAVRSFFAEFLQPFVFSGLVATKDGSIATQLDVTSGNAYLLQTDGSIRINVPLSTTQSTSGHPSTVMYLYLNADGTWGWSTTAGGLFTLPVAQVTTDASSNILTVTDVRNLTINLFSGCIGTTIQLNGTNLLTSGGGALSLSSLTVTGASTFDTHPQVNVTLGGSNQKVLEVTASDGDDYALIINTDGTLSIHNYTSGNDLVKWSTTGTNISNAVEALSTISYGGGNYSLIATSATGAIYSDNGHFKTSGAGVVSASQFNPALGNGGFNCRGNFSGTGSGTFSHGAGTTPTYADVSCSQASASMTTGVASYTSTQVTVTTGAAYTWKGIAI